MNTSIVGKGQIQIADLSNDLDFVTAKTRFRSLLHAHGFRKIRGIPVFDILMTFFLLPFSRQSLSEGIIRNPAVGFGKDALYSMLNSPRSNWRRLLLSVSSPLWRFIAGLTDREKVLILDSTTYSRNRSNSVELLSRVKDSASGTFIRGFKMETAAISDGYSLIPVDFALLANRDGSKRFCGIREDIDKRCCGYQRRKEALQKATDVVCAMVARIQNARLKFDYILTDAWYAKPVTILNLRKYAPVICRLSKAKTKYRFKGKPLNLQQIYNSIKKRRGRAHILASVTVMLKDEVPVKIVFVRHRSRKKWLAILSTDISIPDDEIIRIYGKRWDIEVFFKIAKQHLRLDSEIQSRRFDALIAQISIVFLRYQFVVWRQRSKDDPRTFGELFRDSFPEVRDLTLVESISRIVGIMLHIAKTHAQNGSVCTKSLKEIFYHSIELFFDDPNEYCSQSLIT